MNVISIILPHYVYDSETMCNVMLTDVTRAKQRCLTRVPKSSLHGFASVIFTTEMAVTSQMIVKFLNPLIIIDHNGLLLNAIIGCAIFSWRISFPDNMKCAHVFNGFSFSCDIIIYLFREQIFLIGCDFFLLSQYVVQIIYPRNFDNVIYYLRYGY